jgi:hypothetical protein
MRRGNLGGEDRDSGHHRGGGHRRERPQDRDRPEALGELDSPHGEGHGEASDEPRRAATESVDPASQLKTDQERAHHADAQQTPEDVDAVSEVGDVLAEMKLQRDPRHEQHNGGRHPEELGCIESIGGGGVRFVHGLAHHSTGCCGCLLGLAGRRTPVFR